MKRGLTEKGPKNVARGLINSTQYQTELINSRDRNNSLFIYFPIIIIIGIRHDLEIYGYTSLFRIILNYDTVVA